MRRSSRLLKVALALAVTLILMGAGLALAQGPAAQNSTAVLVAPGIQDVSMFLVPNGSGTPFQNCFERGGNQVNAQILVTILDTNFIPAMGVIPNRIRIEEMLTSLAWCTNPTLPVPPHYPNYADLPTNNLGQTQFTLAYFGGGSVEAAATGGTYVWLLENSGTWNRIPTPVNVSYNSPDINADGVVNLSDVAVFANDFFTGYNYRSDYNYDQVINLADVAMFAGSMGANCP